MKYDFTSILDRTGMDSIAVAPDEDPYGIAPVGKIKEGFDLIPMWVADMNFPTAPTICEAMIERAKHPAFGYFGPRKEYYDSIIRWQEVRNGVTGLEQKHIGYQNGVLGGVLSALAVLCSPGDNVLVHAPTYVGFLEEVGQMGYHLIGSELVRDENGVWRMDYDDMEKKIRQYHIHTTIFCSPHNPTGRVWEREELERAFEIFERNNVYVVSDEIWSDLILEGHKHIPLQSVSEDARNRTVAFYAPSKTFNLAGLVGSYHIIYNDYLRARIKRQSALSVYNAMNVLSMHALIGAYKDEGMEWVDELRTVLTGNVDFAYEFIKSNFKGVEVSKPEGTYMLLLDCGQWLKEHDKTLDELLLAGVEVGVLWQDGRQFNREDSIRMNLALPLSRVQEAFERLKQYAFV
ncbi:MAG: aminotransferase class I/II-fold pyridoxal phosphate-dependent enzyme [Clostridiales bacterium]|nr:aminotransferase class I/II-fold pyridoxal phosphate-dependent enzyme [Clostridiales bacterium]MBQ3323042.1 aminotransferase class I/II-fold pyridoxal phosphate-dependent enzyme [Bacillota bacterium]